MARDDLIEATRLAWRWHGHQTRKGKPTSYMSHLLQVQGLVLDHDSNTGKIAVTNGVVVELR